VDHLRHFKRDDALGAMLVRKRRELFERPESKRAGSVYAQG
jgi:hypothetical protein